MVIVDVGGVEGFTVISVEKLSNVSLWLHFIICILLNY